MSLKKASSPWQQTSHSLYRQLSAHPTPTGGGPDEGDGEVSGDDLDG